MKKIVRIAGAAIVCIIILVSVYIFFTKRNQPSLDDSVELTEIQKLVTRDVSSDYPATPREVVKLYSRIIACFYDGGYTEEELYRLGDMARELFDEKLLENNLREDYFANLKTEIEEYKQTSKRISMWRVSKTSEITYDTINGYDYAYVKASYYLTSSEYYGYAKQTYELRKDESGRWRILAFYKTEAEDSDE